MDEDTELENTIVSYFRLLTPSAEAINTLEQLSTGVVLAEVLSQVEGVRIDLSRVATASGWTNSLNNLKLVVRQLEGFHREQLQQPLDRQELDVLKVAKFQDRQELLKLVRVVLAVLTQASNKSHFISKIMELPSEQQHLMARLIQRALSMQPQPRETGSPDGLLKEKHDLLHKLNELEQQVAALTVETDELRVDRDRLAKQLAQQTARTQYLEEEAAQLKLSSLDAKIEMISVIEKEQTNSLVENLKERLIAVSIEHEKEIIKYRQEIEIMERNASRFNELEKVADDYLDTIKELQARLTEASRDKEGMLRQLEEAAKKLEAQSANERTLSDRLKKLEYENVNLRRESERQAVRTNELKQTISKITAPPQDSNKSFRNTTKLSDLLPEIDATSQQNRVQQLEKEVEILNNRNKELERELSKCRLRAERCDKLEDEKRKMEEVLLDYSNSRGEEIEVLTTAMYELRVRYKNLLRKYEERQNQSNQRQEGKAQQTSFS